MIKQVFFQHEKARPHTSLPKREAITKFEWNFLPRSPYSPDLAPSNFQLSGPLKNALRGSRFAKNLELKHCVTGELGRFSKVLSDHQRASHT
jgi:hypothetical protein